MSSEGIVVVEVGATKKGYHIHKALLVHHSENFCRALWGPWKEAEEQSVWLDDIDASECECLHRTRCFQELRTADKL